MVEVIYLKEMKMKNRKWKSFRIEEIFIVVDGFYNKKPPMTGGNLPFLGATEKNNGITGYTDLETVYMWTKTGEETDKTCKNKLFGPNWIAVTNNGSVGHAYFMPYQYTSSHDVTSLYLPDRDLTENLALFLIEMLKRAGDHFLMQENGVQFDCEKPRFIYLSKMTARLTGCSWKSIFKLN